MKKAIAVLLVILFASAARSSLSAGSVSFLVFPPENASRNSSLSWVGEGISLSLTEQLRIPGVEAFGREDRISFVEGADLPPNATLSHASMIHVARHVSADNLVMGAYSGTEESIRIVLRTLDLKLLKLGSEIVATGPLSALAQMENELAWAILSNSGLNGTYAREKFSERVRSIPNSAYSSFVQSLLVPDPQDQIRLLLKAVQLHADFPEAQFSLGRYYHQQGDCPATIDHLAKVGNRRSSFLEDQFIIGNCYLKINDAVSAIRTYSAIQAFVHSAQVLNNAGVANLIKGDFTLAAQNLVEAHNLAKTDPTIALNLAIVRHLQGNSAAARDLLEELERTHPNPEIIQYILSLVLSGQGEKDKAELALTKARQQGIDLGKLKPEDARSWVRLFSSWEGRP